MPIISVNNIEKINYRITMTLGHNKMENLVITKDGIYVIYYIQNCKSISRTGKITNIVQNSKSPHNSYIVFDSSEENSNRKERIYFYQVQMIKDVTPNNAYDIAVANGFEGTVSDWLESLKGYPGKSAYEIAIECGFEGSPEEWLESLKGADGKSAYEIAVDYGFEGTIEDWMAQNGDVTLLKQDVDNIKDSLKWKESVN